MKIKSENLNTSSCIIHSDCFDCIIHVLYIISCVRSANVCLFNLNVAYLASLPMEKEKILYVMIFMFTDLWFADQQTISGFPLVSYITRSSKTCSNHIVIVMFLGWFKK